MTGIPRVNNHATQFGHVRQNIPRLQAPKPFAKELVLLRENIHVAALSKRRMACFHSYVNASDTCAEWHVTWAPLIARDAMRQVEHGL